MTEILERCYLQGKSMKLLFFVPFLAFYVLIPLYSYMNKIANDFTYFDSMQDTCLRIVPIACVWWIYLILEEYIEGDGNEVLILKGGIITVVGNYFCLNILCYLPIFLLGSSPENEPLDLFLPLCILTFFMYGLVLTVSFLFRNISMAILVVLFYAVYNTLNFRDIDLPFLYIDMYGTDYAAPFLIIGCILWGISIKLSKKLQ